MKNLKDKAAMKILLAMDGSKYSRMAAKEVANRTYSPNTKILILSVIDKVALSRNIGPMGVLKEYSKEAELNAKKYAEEACGFAQDVIRKKNPDLIVTHKVLEGSPKNVILMEAEKFGADLIVVGSHGNGAIKRFLLGSVSHAISLHAKCSVEIIRK